MKPHGWEFPAEGAHRAASTIESTSARLTSEDGSKARGLHREASTGWRSRRPSSLNGVAPARTGLSDSLRAFADDYRLGWALVRRRFREGPHDDLGVVERIGLASTADEPFGVLIDGEKDESPGPQEFRLVPCGVDLLATGADGR